MPNEDSYAREKLTAYAAVKAACALTQAVQAEIDASVLEKKDKSPVTVADFGSQAMICRRIREEFPDDPIIAEEDSKALREPEQESILTQVVRHVAAREERDVTADEACSWIDFGGAKSYSERFWTLDPIDGTKGFLRGEQYAVSLALIEKGEIVVSAMGCPNLSVTAGSDRRGVVFLAVRGKGAQAVPLAEGGDPEEVRVHIGRSMPDVRFCESVESGHTSHDHSARIAEALGIVAEPVRLDSQAKYAVVGRGEADIYLRLPTRPNYVERIWDHAGGHLVVTEAGGTVTDVYGKPLDFTHGAGLTENKGVVVTNGAIHRRVLEQVQAVLGIESAV
jgi:3'(2'), 5'-bisphosphate nucleotidase